MYSQEKNDFLIFHILIFYVIFKAYLLPGIFLQRVCLMLYHTLQLEFLIYFCEKIG